MKNLQLSLIKKWFEMTKSGEKTEDYREITPYWCNRFLLYDGNTQPNDWWDVLQRFSGPAFESDLKEAFNYGISFKEFNTNTMTLGYPKSTDKERIIRLDHKGIEIRTGNHEWGAEKGKVYFVVKHGKMLG